MTDRFVGPFSVIELFFCFRLDCKKLTKKTSVPQSGKCLLLNNFDSVKQVTAKLCTFVELLEPKILRLSIFPESLCEWQFQVEKVFLSCTGFMKNVAISQLLNRFGIHFLCGFSTRFYT